MIGSLILLIVLIAVNAVFAAAEIAVISTNQTRLKKLSAEGSRKADRLLRLTAQPAGFLATIQVAITLAGLLQSAFAAESFAEPLVEVMVKAGISVDPDILKTAAIIVITLVLSYFTLVFGELVPKRIAMKKSEALALALANMLYAISRIFAPLVWLLTVSTNGIFRLFGINPDENDEAVTEEEIRMLLNEGRQQGTIPKEENEIIQNVFELDDTGVEELCTHRRDIISLRAADSDERWAETIRNNRHTFYPVCGKSSDDVIGVLDTRDYFRTDNKSRDSLMDNAVKPAFCVPDSMTANVLFSQMKKQRRYFAVIIDEYGGLSGVITMHDLLQSIVGDLNEIGSKDVAEPIVKLSENEWQIQGSASLGEVEAAVGVVFDSDICETFGGYICGQLGRVPADGERFSLDTEKLIISVLSVRNRTIGAVCVRLKQAVK